MELLRSPQNKNHFTLSESGDLKNQFRNQSRRNRDSSKRDTKTDRNLDTVFPTLYN